MMTAVWTSFEGTDIESDIYSINVDGTRERRLTDSPGLDGFPSWSPDGQRLVFATDRAGGNWELCVMNSDGTEQQRLTNTSEKDEGIPAWSPDREKIA
jgi:TolB protein